MRIIEQLLISECFLCFSLLFHCFFKLFCAGKNKLASEVTVTLPPPGVTKVTLLNKLTVPHSRTWGFRGTYGRIQWL